MDDSEKKSEKKKIHALKGFIYDNQDAKLLIFSKIF